MSVEFRHIDELGPEKIVEIYAAGSGLKAVVVIDNTAAGPAIGGVRMAADVSANECVRLARAMSLKNAMAGLAHGGGKSVILADAKTPLPQKDRLLRSFAQAISELVDYIPGPDMGTDETSMAIIKSEIDRAVGLPRELGGIPLDEIGATGYGLACALETAAPLADLSLEGATLVIQGFGSVGQHAARFLESRGARVVGVSDSGGARWCDQGFDLEQLLLAKSLGRSVASSEQGELLDPNDLIAVECDVWIPAARPDVIRRDNVERMRCRLVAQGANIPATEEAEQCLADRGILVLPDFVANAGGVICAAVEYQRGSETQAMDTIERRIKDNIAAVLSRASTKGETPRAAANDIARERILRAMSFRR